MAHNFSSTIEQKRYSVRVWEEERNNQEKRISSKPSTNIRVCVYIEYWFRSIFHTRASTWPRVLRIRQVTTIIGRTKRKRRVLQRKILQFHHHHAYIGIAVKTDNEWKSGSDISENKHYESLETVSHTYVCVRFECLVFIYSARI